jgi:aminoglycoside 6-adenylyltransferase
MRGEHEVLDLIIGTARADERIRAAVLSGSRANPNAFRDIFQDFDITYLVRDVEPFKQDRTWIRRFGEMMIFQTPEAMGSPAPLRDGRFSYLMQFTDGNRIDLTLLPLWKLGSHEWESASAPLLDKDGLLEHLPPASERDYLPTRPSAKEFEDCCNEFWWVCPYVAKGLWREQVIHAKHVLDHPVRQQLMKMLLWYAGARTGFGRNFGADGKHLQQSLEPELWQGLKRTYSGAEVGETWEALFAACGLFRRAATLVAMEFGFRYPHADDERVSRHLAHVRGLPKDATAI